MEFFFHARFKKAGRIIFTHPESFILLIHRSSITMFSTFLPKSSSSAKIITPQANMSAENALLIDDFVNITMDTDGVEQSALSTKITPRHDTIGLDAPQKSTQFCTTVTARSLPEDDESARAPIDIVVALDVSGSMSGRKLDLCKDTLALLLRELGSDDRFGLVTFGDEATLQIPTRKLTKANKESALAKIKSLHTAGCTNLSGGIGLAAHELHSVESPHEVRTIFLLTDGLANRGIADRQGIENLTKSCLGASADSRPVAIHCFGYGTDHDHEMLGDISKATEGGSYCFVDKDSDVSSAFGDALGGVLSVVAQNTFVRIKVPLEASELGVSILHVKHDKAEKQPDGSYKIAIGDFYAEESRDIIVETSLARKGLAVNVPHMTVSLSYLDTVNKKLETSSDVIGSIARPDGNEVSKTNSHVALQCIRVRTTEVITETEALAESGQLAKARSSIGAYINNLQQEAAQMEETTNPLIVQFQSELHTILSGLSSRAEYNATGAKYMHSRFQTHTMQRCTEASADSVNAYRSSKKAAMASKMKSDGKLY